MAANRWRLPISTAVRLRLPWSASCPSSGYTVEISPGAPGADGKATIGEYRGVVGFNAPGVLNGDVTAGTPPSLKLPIPVQVGVKIDRISEVDSSGEDFSCYFGSVRMDWQDPTLAFSPDTCNCAYKLYTEKGSLIASSPIPKAIGRTSAFSTNRATAGDRTAP